LRVVADQIGAPTAAADLAAALVVIARQIARGSRQGGAAHWGTFHLTGAGAVSWHGFAEAIVDLAAPMLGRRPPVVPIASAEYRAAARRPANSLLDCGKIGRAYGIRPRPWREGLAAVVAELFATGSCGEKR
jgi:dTDP-4-dehydrorhamnose reductase